MDDFWQRFRNQFNDNEWAHLIRETEFKDALLKCDEKNIQSIAVKILIGDGKTKAEERELQKYYEKFGKHHDYLASKNQD